MIGNKKNVNPENTTASIKPHDRTSEKCQKLKNGAFGANLDFLANLRKNVT